MKVFKKKKYLNLINSKSKINKICIEKNVNKMCSKLNKASIYDCRCRQIFDIHLHVHNYSGQIRSYNSCISADGIHGIINHIEAKKQKINFQTIICKF